MFTQLIFRVKPFTAHLTLVGKVLFLNVTVKMSNGEWFEVPAPPVSGRGYVFIAVRTKEVAKYVRLNMRT